MRKRRYTEEQIVQILKEGESGLAVTDVCRKFGVSEATFSAGRQRMSGLGQLKL